MSGKRENKPKCPGDLTSVEKMLGWSRVVKGVGGRRRRKEQMGGKGERSGGGKGGGRKE